MNYERIFTYIGIAALVLLLTGLAGWYLFLRNETSGIEDVANSRGFSIGIPSFIGSRGSTAANVSPEVTTGGSAFSQFLGFRQEVEGAPASRGNTEEGAESLERRAPRFWRVSSAPVAGASFSLGSSTRLRYIERASGHVFEADPVTGHVARMTNTLTPRVYEASIGSTTVVQRIIQDGSPVTLSGTIGTTTAAGLADLEIHDLGADVEDIAVTPSGDLVLIAHAGATSHLIRSEADGSAPKQLLTIPGGDFRIQLLGEQVTLVERAGSGIAGSAYRAAAPLTPLIRNILGLTLRAQQGTDNILFASDDGTTLKLFAKLGTASVVEIPLTTTAEKCVWAPKGQVAYCAAPRNATPPQFHDRWYRGEIHTEDFWYTIDTAGAKADVLFRIDSTNALDVENPVIDQNGEYLAFQNARDKSLWMLRIKE